MKTFAASLLLLIVAVSTSQAQSKSFMAFKEKFSGLDDVYCFGTNGFLARVILSIAEEEEINDAVKSIHKIRVVTVPREAFQHEKVTVAGFRNVLRNDAFEELVTIHDGADKIYVYQQSTEKNDNRYAILVDEDDEVTLIEMCGYIDPAVLAKYKTTSYHKIE